MSTTNQSEIRLTRIADERDVNQQLHENLLAAVEAREDKILSPAEQAQVEMYRERAGDLDSEIKALLATIEQNKISVEESKKIRRVLSGNLGDTIDVEGDEIVYRSMAAFARDVILTGSGRVVGQIAAQFGEPQEIVRAKERLQMLQRVPANTLSSNVGGLTPPQHIAQIFQVIDESRALVASAQRADLERGTLTYPVVATKPVVAVQSTQKTEAGNTGMVIDMVTATASTYLGGGDLSWQAINWSSPNALDLWFRLVAADYALKTETDAATVVSASGFLNNIATTVAAGATFATLMTGIGAGYSEVFANSGRQANTVYMAPDYYGYLIGLTSSAFTQFTNVGASNIGPLNIVVSRGLNAGEVIVGDSAGLLVAETSGAPVELRVVEPAIGGLEVGLIGAFEAVVVDDGAFATVSTAS